MSKLTITQVEMPTSKYSIKCPNTMTPKYIVIHNTGNDATAMNEISYMISNNNKVSFHYAVDNTRAVQGVPINRNAWHAGDGASGKGNKYGIGIEICYSKSGGDSFAKAEENGAYLAALLLKQLNLPISAMIRHYDCSGKDCPSRTMKLGYDRFVEMVQTNLDKLNGATTSTASTTTTASATTSSLTIDGYFGQATISASQKALNTTVDGYISKQPTTNKKYLSNAVTPYWEFTSKYTGGSSLIKAIQKLVGTSVDGYCGSGTIKKMQTFLKNKGYYTGSVDGYMGSNTVKAWQKYINSIM